MAEVREHELVIVGGGVAGLTAGIYGARYALDLMLLSESGPGGQAATATTIENFPGFPEGISGPELVMRLAQQAQNFGVEMQTGKVERVERDGERWDIITGDITWSTMAIILCVGASPRRMKVPGERDLFGRGVSYCATCDGFFYRDKTVAVIGGGNTAIEEALYLSDLAERVFVVHRRDQLRADPIIAQRAFERENIEVIWDSVVASVDGQDEVEGLNLHNNKTDQDSNLVVDGVFVAIGYEPNTGFLEGLLELEDGFIVANCRMETSQPGIFVAGDVRNTPLRQVVTAVGDAAIAADSAYRYVSERRHLGR